MILMEAQLSTLSYEPQNLIPDAEPQLGYS